MKNKRKHPKSEDFRCYSGAAGRIRTADLILTKKVEGLRPPTSPRFCADTSLLSSQKFFSLEIDRILLLFLIIYKDVFTKPVISNKLNTSFIIFLPATTTYSAPAHLSSNRHHLFSKINKNLSGVSSNIGYPFRYNKVRK